MDGVNEAVTAGAIEDPRHQISPADDWNELFALVDQEGKSVDEDSARSRPTNTGAVLSLLTVSETLVSFHISRSKPTST